MHYSPHSNYHNKKCSDDGEKKKKGKKEKTNKVFGGRRHFQLEPGRRKREVVAHSAAGRASERETLPLPFFSIFFFGGNFFFFIFLFLAAGSNLAAG